MEPRWWFDVEGNGELPGRGVYVLGTLHGTMAESEMAEVVYADGSPTNLMMGVRVQYSTPATGSLPSLFIPNAKLDHVPVGSTLRAVDFDEWKSRRAHALSGS